MKYKIQINHVLGGVLFEYESDKPATDRERLERATRAGATLYGANLYGANLYGATLHSVKEDFYKVLSVAKKEVKNLYKSVLEGRIDGSQYEGECACLVGTVAKIRKEKYDNLKIDLRPNASRPAEMFFTGIRAGDTPNSNPLAAIVQDWMQEFMKAHRIAIPVPKIVWTTTRGKK